ncbi:MAG: hypothetical protein ABSE49_10165 [Polyangiaceae bacterium]|jgi:hypothetical protein
MSTAEATPEEAPPEDVRAPRSRVPPSSPGLSAAWLLRAAAFTAVAAGITGLLVAPGVRGNATEAVVVAADRSAAALAYFLLALLVALVIWAGRELVRAHDIPVAARAALVASGSVVVALSAPSLRERLLPWMAVLVVAASAVAVIAGAYASARAPHTRAIAGVLFALAFAAIARLAAWELAQAASERASVQLYSVSRGLATAGVMFEAIGQLATVTWLGTRSKLTGQLGSTLALVVAFVLTWGVAKGVHGDAAPWQAMLHTALADAPGVPPPYWLDGVATFLVPASLLLALASAAQPNQVAVLVSTIALALVSRGSFDAPLRALCAVAAAQWAALAGYDERAMWRTLIDDRKRRVAEGDIPSGERP